MRNAAVRTKGAFSLPNSFKFKTGVVVRLRSGGPRMVIETQHDLNATEPFRSYGVAWISFGHVERARVMEKSLRRCYWIF